MNNIHSNAYNFLSFVSAGVDLRTGTYSCSISLSALLANTLSGPSLPLSLGFNALNTNDLGFGTGWSIPLSRYNRRTRQLSLSTGATHIASIGPGQFVIADKKVRDLKTTRVGDELIIEHKTGIVEVLTNPSLNWDEWLVSKIYSAQGRVVNLSYSVVGGRRLLHEIRDENQLLLTVDVSAVSQVASSMTLWPESVTDKLVFRFARNGKQLNKITLFMGNQAAASWRFTYTTIGGLPQITRLELPTGGVEQIEYRADAMRLPSDAPIRALPAVASYTVFPRADQASIRREYSYSAENYFGYNANIKWRNDGDSLYQATGNYRYICTEDLMLGSGMQKQLIRRTRRTYNRFHLQIEETISQNGKTVRTLTEYHEISGHGFDGQPGNFQLPSRTETSYFDAAAPDVVRREVTLTTYDDCGNILKQVSPTGTTEVFEYYPVGASDGCPADSFAEVRWLKQKTLIPAPGRAPAPTLISRYRYGEFRSASPERGTFLAVIQEAISQLDPFEQSAGTSRRGQNASGKPYMLIERQYDADPKSISFGRIRQKTEAVEGTASVFDYSYELLDGALCTHTTVIGHDGTRSTKDVWHNRLTGAEIKTVGQLGVTSETTHDRLGRKALEVLAPKTSSQVFRTHSYKLADKLTDPVESRTVAANGAMTLTQLDGMGRKSTVDVQDMDLAGRPMCRIYSVKYDELGHLIEETNTDWLDGKPYALTTRHIYDDWGNRQETIGPDGITQLDQHDPIALTQTQGIANAGKTVIHLNVFGKQDSVERFDRNGKSIGITKYRYDGLGRCVEQTDPLGRTTGFSYDLADRLVLTRLPDGATVKKAFVSHSTENLATHIWVNDYLVGQRTYDGLLRVTSLTVGGRTETFTYEGAQPSPATHTSASGKVRSYKYDPALNNQMVERSVDGNNDLSASYRYDNRHARLLQASCPGNQQTRDYSPSGRLAGDQLSEGAARHKTAQRSSLNGLPIAYTDASGLEQVIDYDPLCRIAQVRQGTVKADYSYDAFGRISKIETVDTQQQRKLTTQLEYDDFGREVRRTLRVDLNPAEELSQRFDGSDKLVQRTLKRGNTVLRDETFTYDLRGRLVHYRCAGTQRPVDASGKAIRTQTYLFDELDNIRQLKTVFIGGENIATYEYQYPDKTQLSRVSHSHPDYAAQQATFTYDRDGNQLNDQRGRRMIYDDLGRLASVAQEQP